MTVTPKPRNTLIPADQSVNLHLTVNSEAEQRRLRKEGDQTPPRHNLRIYVTPIETLAGLVNMPLNEAHFSVNLILHDPVICMLIRQSPPPSNKAHGVIGIHRLIRNSHLQKGLADDVYANWILKFKEIAQFEGTKGREGWWRHGMKFRIENQTLVLLEV